MRLERTAGSGQREAAQEEKISRVSEALKCKLQTALGEYKKNHLESWYRVFKFEKSKQRYSFMYETIMGLNADENPVEVLALVSSLLESNSKGLKDILCNSIFSSVYSHQNGARVGEDRSDLIDDDWLHKNRVVRTYVSEKYAITKTDTAEKKKKWIRSRIQDPYRSSFMEKKYEYTQSMKTDGTSVARV